MLKNLMSNSTSKLNNLMSTIKSDKIDLKAIENQVSTLFEDHFKTVSNISTSKKVTIPGVSVQQEQCAVLNLGFMINVIVFFNLGIAVNVEFGFNIHQGVSITEEIKITKATPATAILDAEIMSSSIAAAL
jgi:hypothetical protein